MRSRLLLPLLGLAVGVPSAADAGFDPASTVFLTWSADPTTTVDVQWLDGGTPMPASPGTAAAVEGSWPIAPAGGGGTSFTHLAAEGAATPAADASATASVGWSDDLLRVVMEVTDDELDEAADDALYEGDAVEVMIYRRRPGKRDPGLQIIATPGVGPAERGPRTMIFDHGEDLSPEQEAAFAVTSERTEAGYRVELSVPWPGGASAAAGDRFGLQLVVNDRDGGGRKRRLLLHPAGDAHSNPASTADVLLSHGPTGPVRVGARCSAGDDGELFVTVSGNGTLAGELLTLRSGSVLLGELTLEARPGGAGGRLPLPEGVTFAAGTVHRGGEVVGRFAVPDALRRVPGPARRVTLSAGGGSVPTVSETIAFEADRPSGIRLHRARFTGLEPGTSQDLTIDGVGGPWAFETAPATLDRSLVFAEGGDVGTGPFVRPLHREAAAWDPLFGVVGGDLAYADGTNASDWVRYLQDWHAEMREEAGGRTPAGEAVDRLIPMVVCIGNHEVRGGFGNDRSQSPLFNAAFGGLFRDERNFATLDFGDYLSLLLLDSGHTTDPAGEQTDWLIRSLEERVSVPHLFAVYHVPMYPSHRTFEGGSRGEARLAMRANWLEPFARFGVPVAFEHDDHTYKRSVPMSRGEEVAPGSAGSTVYVGDGAWGKGDRAADVRPYLYESQSKRNVIRVEIRPDGTRSFLAVDPDGGVIDVFDMSTPRPGAAAGPTD